MKRHGTLMSQNYKEPVSGSFEDITDVIFQHLGGESSNSKAEDGQIDRHY